MYNKTTWTPRTATNKFLKANETTDSVELTNDPSGVTVSGTPFTADNMNNIEDGIQSAHYTDFTQPSTLSNISSGEELTSRWGKVKKAINLIIGWLNQGVKTTDSPTFASINTGHGANELYPMNQGVRSTDSPVFKSIELTRSTPYIDFHFDSDSADYTSRIIESSKGTLSILGNATIAGSLSAPTVNTGQGANELYPMNQGVRTTDSPTFANATISGHNIDSELDTLNGRVNQGVKTTDNPTFDKGIKTLNGFAGGYNASTALGGAVGASAGSINGFAGGASASANYVNSSALGTGAVATAINQIKLGTTDNTVLLGNGATVTSDKRDKIDIEDNDLGLEFLLKVVTKKFRKNPRELYYIRDDKGEVQKDKNNNLVYDKKAHEAGVKKGKRFHRGMIAQELEASVDNMNFSAVKHFSYSDDKNNDEYAIDYGQFIPICIKAIQEQQEQIKKLTKLLGK